jgi:hypothetical protein
MQEFILREPVDSTAMRALRIVVVHFLFVHHVQSIANGFFAECERSVTLLTTELHELTLLP